MKFIKERFIKANRVAAPKSTVPCSEVVGGLVTTLRTLKRSELVLLKRQYNKYELKNSVSMFNSFLVQIMGGTIVIFTTMIANQ